MKYIKYVLVQVSVFLSSTVPDKLESCPIYDQIDRCLLSVLYGINCG